MASLRTEEGYHYDKQTLLREHELLLARTRSNDTIGITTKTIELESSKLIELNSLKAIKISDLAPGNSYDNKLIYSTQITPVAIAEAVYFVIEDECGNVCRASVLPIFNTFPLVKGVTLVFSNPIYKMSISGRYTLMVHDSSHISLLQVNSPSKSISNLFSSDLPTPKLGQLYKPTGVTSPSPLFKPSLFDEKFQQAFNLTPIARPSLFGTHTGRMNLAQNPISFGQVDFNQFSPQLFNQESLKNSISLTQKFQPQQLQQQQQPQQQPQQQQPQPQPQQPQPQQQQPSPHSQDPFQMSSIKISEVYNSVTGIFDSILKGNTLFKEGRYLQAIVQYTCAIQANDTNPAFYQKRAFCYFKWFEFENALFDFLKVNSLEPENAKTQYLIALTWSKLGNHKLCLALLSKIKPKDNVDSRSIEIQVRKEELLIENIEGKFDFDKLRQNYIDSNPNNIGDYIGPIKILNTSNHERGIFTTRDIKKGENICIVKALEFANSNINYCECDFCRKNILKFVLKDRSLHSELIEEARKSRLTTVRLASLCDRSIKNVNIELYSSCGNEFAKNFDISLYPLEELQSLIKKNLVLQFDHGDIAYQYNIKPNTIFPQLFWGIWLLPSFINHSCTPNVLNIYIGDICIVRAITGIPEGEEVFTSYLPVPYFPKVQKRSDYLGFKCNCQLCEFERNQNVSDFISELITLDNYLRKFVDPSICRVHPSIRKEQQIITEKLSKEKWLDISNKVLKYVKQLKSKATGDFLSVSFQSCIIHLLRVSHSQTDVFDLALKAEPYFSHFEPGTYSIFWGSLYGNVIENNKLKNPRFQHVEKNYIATRNLFT